jgi:5'-methylthioadenosine phosphorylase
MLAVIGGTGVYHIDGLEIIDTFDIPTPYGSPSSAISKTLYKGQNLYFLARHGTSHHLMPHEVNYRANIYALKKLGVKQIVGISAVGSLNENIHPGDFVIPEHYFDFVKTPRDKSFFGEGLVAHVSTAKTTCPHLTHHLKNEAQSLNMTMHTGATYAGVDGPRLGTKAESLFLKNHAKCDVLGMTNVPEAFLAREAQICYATIGVVTDYDCWLDDEQKHVSVQDVLKLYGDSIENVKKLIKTFLEKPRPKMNNDFRKVLQYSVLTPKENLTQEKKELLEVLSL